MPLVLFFLLLNTFLSAWKWHVLLQSDGVDIPLCTLTGSYMVGTFFNMFLPSNIGGDSYRIFDIKQRGNDVMQSATSVFADRLSGFFALVTLSLVSSVFVVRATSELYFLLLPLSIFIVLLGLIWALYNQEAIRGITRMVGLHRLEVFSRNLEKVFSSFGRYGARFNTIAKVLLISFSFQSLVILIVFIMAKSLGNIRTLLLFRRLRSPDHLDGGFAHIGLRHRRSRYRLRLFFRGGGHGGIRVAFFGAAVSPDDHLLFALRRNGVVGENREGRPRSEIRGGSLGAGGRTG